MARLERNTRWVGDNKLILYVHIMKNKLEIIIILSMVMFVVMLVAKHLFGIICMGGAVIASIMTYREYMGK
jgi:hypothetical protein